MTPKHKRELKEFLKWMVATGHGRNNRIPMWKLVQLALQDGNYDIPQWSTRISAASPPEDIMILARLLPVLRRRLRTVLLRTIKELSASRRGHVSNTNSRG